MKYPDFFKWILDKVTFAEMMFFEIQPEDDVFVQAFLSMEICTLVVLHEVLFMISFYLYLRGFSLL